jgi:hypothetical protein
MTAYLAEGCVCLLKEPTMEAMSCGLLSLGLCSESIERTAWERPKMQSEKMSSVHRCLRCV